MRSNDVIILENGLKLVLCLDTTKHTTAANLIIKFGGSDYKIKQNNKIIDIPPGTAHFLEHLLIEHSIYGNIVNKFDEKNAISNGDTTKERTRFYIDTVTNFEENLVELIKAINIKNFNEDDVNITKKAIVKERMMKEDNKWLKLYKKTYECLFKNIQCPNTLGEISDIENMNYEKLSFFYDMFYQFDNQVLVISGNFDKEKIKQLVIDTYDGIKKDKIEYERLMINEPDEVNNKIGIVKYDMHLNYVKLTYKINLDNYTCFEKLQLDFILYWFLLYNFDGASKLYSDFVKQNICNENINFNIELENNFFIINIGAHILNEKEFIKKIETVMKNKPMNEEDFNLRKKECIIKLILREDSIIAQTMPFIDNIILFNYDKMDSIEDIENITFEKYKNLINSLDFSNYSILKLENK